MQALIRYVEAVVPPERIFVGNTHHDDLVLNDVMFCAEPRRRCGNAGPIHSRELRQTRGLRQLQRVAKRDGGS